MPEGGACQQDDQGGKNDGHDLPALAEAADGQMQTEYDQDGIDGDPEQMNHGDLLGTSVATDVPWQKNLIIYYHAGPFVNRPDKKAARKRRTAADHFLTMTYSPRPLRLMTMNVPLGNGRLYWTPFMTQVRPSSK